MKILIISLVIGLFLLISFQACLAETVLIGPVEGGDVTVTVVPNALSVAIKNRSDNSTVSAIAFGDIPVSTEAKAAPQYLEVTYACYYGPNPPVWGIDIYTNNTDATTGFAKGGLIHDSDTSIRIPMCYSTYDDLQPSISDPSGPPISDPWIYIIDKNDTDDPGTPDQTDWDYLLQMNYPRIIYGFENGESFLQMDASSCTSPVYVYPAGLFDNCVPGNYSTVFYLDLYHL